MLLHRHRAIIWYAFGVAWLNSRGWGWGCFKVWCVFALLCIFVVLFACKQWHYVDNVPTQQAVKLVVVGPGFVEQCWFGLFLGDQWQWKIGKMALQSVTLTLKLSLEMPYFWDWWEKLHFCYLQDRRFYQMEAHVFQNFFLRSDLTFPVKRGIKLPISARHWHVLIARF